MEPDPAQRYWRAPVAIDQPLGRFDPANLEEFARLADFLPTLCWLALPDGHIVWYNRRWHEYCGSTPEDMEGWGWQSVHDPAILPRVMEGWQASIASGEPFEMVFPLKGRDGSFRPFLTRIIPLLGPDGTIQRWFGTNTDISEQMRAEAALVDSEARFKVLTDAIPQMVWSTLPDGYHDFYNAQWYEFTGVPAGSTDGEAWNGMFHPEDQERAWARWQHSLRTGDPYEIEYRLRRHDGEYRWTLGRALPVRDANGQIVRWIGTCTEIHEAKSNAEQNEVLSRELSHRIKNIFSVIAGLIQLSGRSQSPESKSVFRDLTERVMALGRAHNYARPHSEQSRPELPGDRLAGLLQELTRPYQSSDGSRIEVTCEEIEVDDKGATPLALAIHELATNSAKYGALSSSEGRVRLTASLESEDVRIVWSESGGPEIDGEPTITGFGTKLVELSVEQQLDGTLIREWNRDGLTVTIEVRHDHLHR